MKQSEFEHIAMGIRQKAINIALSTHANADEAEDIAQETMLKLWTLHDELNDKEHAEKLAVHIAHNRAIDFLRRCHTVTLDTGKQVIDEKTTGPAEDMEAKENMEWLETRLAALPSTEYQILRMRQVDRKTTDEIAAILGIGKQSVATMLSRARRKLLNEIRNRTKQ